MESRSGSKYERLRKIGIGSYGVVFKCINRQTGQVVAIKRYSENDLDPIIRKIAMREVRMLRQLKHPNLINLIEVFRRKRRLHLVFDYCELTVLDVIEKYTSSCPLNLIRKIIWQTVNGINYCHTHNCIHRDIKPENILINQSGVVKLCDFGFARSIRSPASPATANQTVVSSSEHFLQARDSRLLDTKNSNQNGSNEYQRNEDSTREDNSNGHSDRQAFTEYVATRWYRAPELLIGEIYYDIKIDIWAIGCVTAELMRGEPVWPGKTDLDQLFTIKSSLGPLTQSQTHTLLSQGIYDQANIERLLDQPASSSDSIEKKLPARVGQSGVDFVTACLQMDPTKRPTSGELLNHEYIYSARMAQFVQKDHAPTHRLPLLGDRTVTLPSLSPTTNRTNSQALLMLTSKQQQQPQQRPAKRFVDAPSESPNHQRALPTQEPGKTSSIPLAISKQQQRMPAKQVCKNNKQYKATNSQQQTFNPVVAQVEAAGKHSKRKQPVKSNNTVNGLTISKPAAAAAAANVTGNNIQDTTPVGKSLLPVAKVRSRETSVQRTTAVAAVTNHHAAGLRDDRSAMTNEAAIDAPPNTGLKTPIERMDPARVVQAQQQQQRQPPTRGSTTTAKQMRTQLGNPSDNLELNKKDEELPEGKENFLNSLKANGHKRKTNIAAANESSASSSNYSDSLGTVRSSSIAFLPPVYQDRRG